MSMSQDTRKLRGILDEIREHRDQVNGAREAINSCIQAIIETAGDNPAAAIEEGVQMLGGAVHTYAEGSAVASVAVDTITGYIVSIGY
jgi:hypothetical protein